MVKAYKHPYKHANFFLLPKIYERFRLLGYRKDLSMQAMFAQAAIEYLEKYEHDEESRSDGE